MMKLLSLSALLPLAAVLTLGACGAQAPTCGAGADGCRELAAQSVTVVIGEVASPIEIHRGVRAPATLFEDWALDVETYLAGTQPYDQVIVRVPTTAVTSSGALMPIKGPRLSVGERVLLFLDKHEINGTKLAGNGFTIVQHSAPEVPLVSGKLTIDGALAKNAGLADAPWEPLDEIIATMRVRQ